MAIKSNDSTKEVTGGGIKLFSGLGDFQVLTINPTMGELHELGIMVKQDPNYFVEFNGEEYFKLTFWIKNEDLTTRFEILMNSTQRKSQNGKFQYINAIGQSTWTDDTTSLPDWYKSEGNHIAVTGEETLVNFTKAWANVANGDDVYFETIDKIVKGDVTELKALVKLLSSNTVRLLIGVKDGKYQTVYTKMFGRTSGNRRDDLFVKKLNDDYGTFNAEFDTTLKWGPFSPELAVITPDENTDTVDEGEDWV